jgi:hypothetical protein
MFGKAGLVVIAALVLGAALVPATAQAAIEVRDQRVNNRFPDGIEFAIVLDTDAEITDARLRFRPLPDSPTTTVRAECTTTNLTTCTVLYGNTQSAILLPGIEIAYSWQIEDANGEELRTDEAIYFFQDDRYRWEEMTEGILTAYYYSGDEEEARTALQAGVETIEKFSALLGTTVETPIRLWVYETAAEMQDAIIGSGSTVAVTLGEVYYSNVATVSMDSSQPLDIIRHELTHIVMRAAEGGSAGRFPAWVDEGTAVYSQANLLPGFGEALQQAIRSNSVVPVSALNSDSIGSTQVGLFYSQSWSLVNYLIDTYGEEQYRAFIAALRTDSVSGALESVYGFDTAGFEAEWRDSLGLPPRAAAATTTPQPTATPRPQASSNSDDNEPDRPANASSDDGGSTNLVPIIGGLTAVLVLAILGTGVYIAKKTGPS